MIRTAIVRRSRAGIPTPETVARYLPSNYEVVGEYTSVLGDAIVIEGEDRQGWTLDDYVIPRLASGLIFAAEVLVAEGEE